eukprot:gb/GECG01004490.1/.p1 GENE.gb/GECG01004490.1/~~gb/GECG01004490.1/.p1  ORF type:complete len:855 (+),score=107.85 gb/GECG01004490.1/:1-2565(+)
MKSVTGKQEVRRDGRRHSFGSSTTGKFSIAHSSSRRRHSLTDPLISDNLSENLHISSSGASASGGSSPPVTTAWTSSEDGVEQGTRRARVPSPTSASLSTAPATPKHPEDTASDSMEERKIVIVATPSDRQTNQSRQATTTPVTSASDVEPDEEPESANEFHNKNLYDTVFSNFDTPMIANNDRTWNVEYNESALPRSFISSRHRVSGLQNLGNSCFFNSTVQNLLNTELLASYFQEDRHFLPNKKPQGKLTSALHQMFLQSRSSGSVSPRNLFSEICRFAPRFQGRAQQDAHELLRFLLDGIHEETLKEKREDKKFERSANDLPDESEPMEPTASANDSSDDSSNSADPHSYNEEPELRSESTPQATTSDVSDSFYGSHNRRTSFIERIFAGKLCNIITCHQCLESSVTMDPCFDLSVPLSHDPQGAKENGKKKPSGYVPDDVKQSIRQITIHPKKEAKSRKSNAQTGQKMKNAEMARLKASQNKFGTPKKNPNKEAKKESLTKRKIVDRLRMSGNARFLEENGLLHTDPQKAAKEFSRAELLRLLEQCQTGSKRSDSEEQLSAQEDTTTAAATGSSESWDRDPPEPESSNPSMYQVWNAVILRHSLIAPLPCAISGRSPPSPWPPLRELNQSQFVREGITVETDPPYTFTSGTLEACLALFSEPELLSAEKGNGYRCEKCGHVRKRELDNMIRESSSNELERLKEEYWEIDRKEGVLHDATKRMLLCSPPPVLTIHLKRFRPTRSGFTKDNSPVSFPLSLDMSPFCVSSNPPEVSEKEALALLQRDQLQQPVKYELQGLVVHSGGMKGGHYVAYIRTENQWYYLSDTTVRRVTQQDALKAQPYLLFYQRVRN